VVIPGKMITTPTVLILGAGASAPFGFPLGIGLRENIIRNLQDNKFRQPLIDAGYPSEGIAEFRRTFLYSGKESVDAFLEHRINYLDIGKAAIAQELLKYELLENLFETLSKNLYAYLYKQLNTAPDDFLKNKLSVVTYNYDRSFEHFLFTSLRNSFGLSDERAAELVMGMPIIHLHGHLGKLAWQGSDGTGYGGDVSVEKINRASKTIKIIHEAVEKDAEFQQAFRLIAKAKRVVFLGFGYDKTNLGRLKINFADTTKEFYGSCFGFSGLEKDRLIKDCSSNIGLGMPTDDALTFLREFVALTG
jgi:hypothetical protein